MKIIEERAWEKYPEVIKHHNLATIDINEEKRKMYIEIAAEQKAIDDANTIMLIQEQKELSLALIEKQKAIDNAELIKLKKELLLATTFAVKAKEKEIVDKACEWLTANADNYYNSSSQADDCFFDTDEMVEAFRMAMEEEKI